MLKIPFVTWIANAAAALTGAYGDVSRQAEVADCSRQTLYYYSVTFHKSVQIWNLRHESDRQQQTIASMPPCQNPGRLRGYGKRYHARI